MDRIVELDILYSKEGNDTEIAVVPAFSDSIDFQATKQVDFGSLELQYNASQGILTIVTDYAVIPVAGFVTANAIGTGPRGKRGKRGNDGADGRIGRDGKPGKLGCPGMPGPEGEEGDDGLDAEDGLTGQVGIYGCPGYKGVDGNIGAEGPVGPDGAIGPPGSGCTMGPVGPDGDTPYAYVHISKEVPTDPLVYLWAQPVEQGEVPEEPAPAPAMSGSINSANIQLASAGGSYYQGIAGFVLSKFAGGVGPFRYEWSGNYPTQEEVTVYETGENATNLNLKCRVYIDPGTSKRIEGSVTLRITDLGNNNAQLVLSGTYAYVGTSASTGGGGGGGGCFLYGSKLALTDGSERLIQQVNEGDNIIGLEIKGLPDSSSGTDDFLKWSSDNMLAANTVVEVTNVTHGTFSYYFKINNELCATVEENLLVRRDKVWSFIRVRDIVVGDYLHHISGEARRIDSIDRIEARCETVSLNVETSDTFYVNGYLVHNLDRNSSNDKH